MGGCQNDGPFWGTDRDPKRDHNLDNHPCRLLKLRERGVKCLEFTALTPDPVSPPLRRRPLPRALPSPPARQLRDSFEFRAQGHPEPSKPQLATLDVVVVFLEP